MRDNPYPSASFQLQGVFEKQKAPDDAGTFEFIKSE
jgi:hypothetical protein